MEFYELHIMYIIFLSLLLNLYVPIALSMLCLSRQPLFFINSITHKNACLSKYPIGRGVTTLQTGLINLMALMQMHCLFIVP